MGKTLNPLPLKPSQITKTPSLLDWRLASFIPSPPGVLTIIFKMPLEKFHSRFQKYIHLPGPGERRKIKQSQVRENGGKMQGWGLGMILRKPKYSTAFARRRMGEKMEDVVLHRIEKAIAFHGWKAKLKHKRYKDPPVCSFKK